MKVVVLAGGYATRLRPLTLTRPKTLLPILGRPLLSWILEALSKAGIREVILSVKYMSQQIKEFIGDGSELGVSVVYIEEDRPLGDAGPLKLIDKAVGLGGTFLVMYGDIFTDVNIKAMLDYHKAKGAIATLTAVPTSNPERYGVLTLNEEGRVIDFVEKPSYKPKSNLVNAGIYVFEPEVLKFIEEGKKQKISTDVIPRLLKLDNVYAYTHNGLWFDIGVPDDFLKANLTALNIFYPNGYVDGTSEVRGEIVEPVYIGRRVKVGRNSIIGPNALLLDHVTVGEYSAIKGSMIMRGSKVGSSVYVRDSIIGEECSIGNWVRIESGTIIGDYVSVADEVFITRRSYILPYKDVADSLWREGEVIL